MRQTIPNPVIAVVAETLGQHYYSHSKLNTLFMEAGAPGDAPEGNCVQTFCTLHAVGALPAISRLGYIMISGGHNEAEFHQRLSNILHGIISQRLIKAADGKNVLPVYEILNITYSEKIYLREWDFSRLEQSLEGDYNISLGKCIYRLWNEEPRHINEDTIRQLFGDQFNMVMNRLGDNTGYKPLVSGMGWDPDGFQKTARPGHSSRSED